MNQRILSNEVSKHIGQKVSMKGWAQTVRTHSKVVFIDLRDRTGLTQLVITGELLETTSQITDESVIAIEGEVTRRPQSLINPNIISGEVEVQIKKVEVLSQAKPLPLPLNDRSVSEETRLKYRYLDLRSQKSANNLRLRHKINNFIRNWLTDLDFTEIETPIISKSTPEGARDFLLPSRIEPGKFYALPQSPQQYKQLLMVAGLERYYQIARCFRDEDSRFDRQPEFIQLDVELSFTSQDEILELVEKLIKELVAKFFPEKTLTFKDFPRLSYDQALAKYQKDAPDLRRDTSNPDELAFVFITDFPLFEWKESENRFDATHHPFTSPTPEFEADFEKRPKEAKAIQYDLVLNGVELGGGSIRIHRPDVLRRIFTFLGNSSETIDANFGHLLEAFNYGVPPHGGVAFGLDRLYMLLFNEPSIREVIAFPKTGDGHDTMMESPSDVDKAQLKDLAIEIRHGKSS